jgi:homoserine dehydrogenase
VSDSPAIVLKFGGSVLRNDADFDTAAREVQRWRADGFLVVAVVSAAAGRTDALLRDCEAEAPRLSPHAMAARVAVGEVESAARLLARLLRAGIAARTVDSSALRLRGRGDAFDAEPVDVDESALRSSLADGVAVVPGFAAIDDERRTVLLGRGGSDFTALFLAQRLRARCRLLKDVGGLHAGDPARGRSGALVPSATWDEVLAAGGGLVQPKAVRFAQQHGLSFEVAAIGAEIATIVGPTGSSAAAHRG